MQNGIEQTYSIADWQLEERQNSVAYDPVRAQAVVHSVTTLHPHLLALLCSKTGVSLGSLSSEVYCKLAHICGYCETKLIDTLTLRSEAVVSPLWLYTDSAALDNLITLDPLGYFTYSASRVLGHLPASERKAHSLATLYNAAAQLPAQQIAVANEVMRTYLAYFQTTQLGKRHSFTITTLAELAASSASLQQFIDQIKATTATQAARLQSSNKLKRPPTVDEIRQLAAKRAGYANYSGSKGINRRAFKEAYIRKQVAYLGVQMDEFFDFTALVNDPSLYKQGFDQVRETPILHNKIKLQANKAAGRRRRNKPNPQILAMFEATSAPVPNQPTNAPKPLPAPPNQAKKGVPSFFNSIKKAAN